MSDRALVLGIVSTTHPAGTADVHSLVVGEALTGIPAYR